MKETKIQIRLTNAERQTLKQQAASQGVTMTNFIRQNVGLPTKKQ
jgi:uncharacterized protein (DUF1778 family)